MVILIYFHQITRLILFNNSRAEGKNANPNILKPIYRIKRSRQDEHTDHGGNFSHNRDMFLRIFHINRCLLQVG